ncbi:DUF7736 domain-containing protein [Raoultella ornithinolytica]|uniref:DUF7736 domain-containing protein n=1 Tax=Raoultella ornithinolytica TaxID=54291 RepID=UPI00292B9039|nr:hypothetical protein [Raoultella ornithinolytica]MDV1101394.1 hypothetical protein [Raoultella ornithinolytica]
MMNKTENQPNDNQLQLELCVARMEACVVRNELFEATSQLLKYQSQENKQLYENLRQIHAELAPKAGGAPGAEAPQGQVGQPDPLRKFTRGQAVIIAGYTGAAVCKPHELRNDVSARKGVKITNAAMKKLTRSHLEDMYKADFLALCPVRFPRSETKLTLEQAIIVAGYTGKMLGDMNAFLADLEKRMGRKVTAPEMSEIGQEKISELYRKDFIMLSI